MMMVGSASKPIYVSRVTKARNCYSNSTKRIKGLISLAEMRVAQNEARACCKISEGVGFLG
jgi:hypothetical protein